tara:strand:- start:2334 stop:2648 length:315 start_codon:yes stop_codon:yes gene_type:complete
MLPLRRRDEDVLENAVREEFIVGVPSFDLDRESANAAPHRRLSARFAEIAFRRGESRTPRSATNVLYRIAAGQGHSLRAARLAPDFFELASPECPDVRQAGRQI